MSKRSTTSSSKTNGTAIAYYRVSTTKQGASGLGLEAQRAAVEAYARTNALAIVSEYTEIETGTRKRKRPILRKALADASATDSTLLIAKLDRLARNVHFISGLMESGASFVAVDNPSVTPLTLHVLAAVAEQEAMMISSRTKAALDATKARGTKLGSPQNLTDEARALGPEANRDAAIDAMRPATAYAKRLRSDGMTLREIANQMNEDGFRTREGKLFAAMQIQRLLKR